MSDTTFIHEVGRDSNVRVQHTFDSEEIEELRNIAAAAISPFEFAGDDDDQFRRTMSNAATIVEWTELVLATLEAEPTGLVNLLGEE